MDVNWNSTNVMLKNKETINNSDIGEGYNLSSLDDDLDCLRPVHLPFFAFFHASLLFTSFSPSLS